MQWSDVPLDPSPRTLRQFAGLWIVFFGGLAVWNALGSGAETRALVFGVVALTIGPLGLIVPAAVRPVFVAWITLAFPIGWIVSRVILGALFWGVFTPIGFAWRLTGRDVLRLRRDQRRTTYWMPKEVAKDPASYFRQF